MENRRAGGAAFFILLPRYDGRTAGRGDSSNDEDTGGGGLDIIREDLCDTLNAQDDMSVVGQATSGAQAVALAGEVDCDLVLMDIEMETTTAGIHAAEEILESNRT